MTPMFHAYDGKPFTTVDECLSYERTIPEWALVGLTIDQVRDAMARRETALALSDAIEVIGAAIARDRRAEGEFKRERKTAAPPPLAITGPRTEPDEGRPEQFDRMTEDELLQAIDGAQQEAAE